MHGVYELQVIPPASPASVGQYGLTITPEGRFELICQILMNTPEDRDWRSEWNSSVGTVVQDADTLKLTVEVSEWQIRSSAWNGRGIERDEQPDSAFTGELTPSGIKVSRLPGCVLLRTDRTKPRAIRGLLLPDYDIIDL